MEHVVSGHSKYHRVQAILWRRNLNRSEGGARMDEAPEGRGACPSCGRALGGLFTARGATKGQTAAARLGALIFVVALFSAPTGASAQVVRLNLPAADLAAELEQLARAAGIELLFDRSMVEHLRGQSVSGPFTPRQALTRILVGTGLTFRRSSAGPYILVRAPSTPKPSIVQKAPPAQTGVGAVSELLIIARRSLNVDIPRSRDDIQPYQVFGQDEIEALQPQNVEEFLRAQVVDDTAFPSSIQEPQAASANASSQVNLSGLGIDQTLLLVDGRRLPTTSLQPDLNGIPPEAIERVEVLTSTAGGIYGPGAMGGVVNIVLKRDYKGADFDVSAGETARGDAPEWRANATLGGALPLTGGQFMISASYSQDAGLNFGDRAFTQEALTLARSRGPTGFIPPVATQVNVYSLDGNPLTLIPSLGGGSLGSLMTHLPFAAATAGGPALAAIVQANAGAYDQSLSPDGQGAQQSLLTATQSNAVIGSLRQPFGSRLEAFVDILQFEERGTSNGPFADTRDIFVPAGQAGNPFVNPLSVSFPTPGLVGGLSTEVVTERATLGLIARLGGGWTGELDLTAGRAIEHDQVTEPGVSITVTPFSGASALAAALAAYRPQIANEALNDQFSDFNLRLAGPLLQLPAGAVTMTVLGELLRDRPPPAGSLNIDSIPDSVAGPPPDDRGITKQSTDSLYAEVRVPVAPRDSDLAILRGLELQAAVRADHSEIRDGTPFAFSFGSPTLSENISDSVVQNDVTTAAVTFGASVAPYPGLMMRASFATGFLPLVPNSLASSTTTAAEPYGILSDPRRGGATVGSEASLTVEDLGDAHPKPELARTASVGFVLSPSALPGLRVSIDYTRIETSGGTAAASVTLEQYLLDHESEYPSRIQRAPLTAADAAMGYTGGVVTTINYSTLDKATSAADIFHFEVDDRLGWGAASLRLYARATWEPHLRFQSDPTVPVFDVAGDLDGPLKWRANLGLDWGLGPWTAGANLQIFDQYREMIGLPFLSLENPSNLLLQGSSTIPAQAYLDAYVGYRARFRLASGAVQPVQFRFGIQDLLDQTPPLLVAPNSPFETVGYSTYGDPRGRRFVLTVRTHF
jgi:iron complex outermembrane receptor protein